MFYHWSGALVNGCSSYWYDVRVSTGVPEVPPPPWQQPAARGARRRREPISREAIVDAAMALLDSDGYEAFSMRALAERLGTGAASLYWHVGSKDGLFDLIFDKVIAEVAVPAADPARWQEQVREVAREQRAATHRHRFIVPMSIGRIPMGPNAVLLSERVLAIMRAGGLPPRLAVQGYLLMISAINGFTTDESGREGPPPDTGGSSQSQHGPSQQEMADMISGYFSSLPAADFPNLRELSDEFSLADDDERFELLLDIFVDGLARRAEAAGG